jgi:hypothetical protein
LALAKTGFILGIRHVSTLRPHEETIPARVEAVASEMMRDGVQRDPIIIDGDSATVLDGMHRLAAFSALRIDNAVCCSVDYSSKAVTLRRWARVYTMALGDSFEEALRPAGKVRRTTLAEAFNALESRESGLAVLTSDAAFLPDGKSDLDQAMGSVSAFDVTSEKKGWKRRFVPEDEIDLPLQERRNFVVLIRRLTKDDVVSAGRTGRLFPCKTTMHVIDPRPVAVDFPVAELNGATSETLRERLKGQEGRLLPADSLYGGRRYKERLLLLGQN